MDPAAQLSVGIDGNLSGFERTINRALGLLNQFSGSGARAGNTFDSGFGATINRTTQRVGLGVEQLNNRIALLTQRRNLSLDTSVIARTNREIAGLQARVNQLQNVGMPAPSSGQTSSLMGYAAGWVSVGAAISAASNALSIISDVDRMDRKLQATTTTTFEFNQAQAFSQRLADRYGLSLESLTDSYSNLRASAEGTVLAGKQTDFIFEAVSRRSAKLGLSADQTSGSLLAIAQMMSKGTIQSEELRGQLGERMPGAFNTMARALGVTTRELGKMLEAGEVIAADALPKFAAELNKTAEGAERNATSMAGGMQRVKDQTMLLIAEFGKSAGVDTFFAKMASGLADTLSGVRQLVRDKSWKEFIMATINPVSAVFDPGEMINRAGQKRQQVDQFKQYTTGQRTAKIQNLQESISREERSLQNDTRLTIVDSPKIAARRRALLEQKDLLRDLRGENLKLQYAELQKNSVAEDKKTPARKAELADLKAELKSLTAKRQQLNTQNKELTADQLIRMSQLKRQIEASQAAAQRSEAAKLADPGAFYEGLQKRKKALEETRAGLRAMGKDLDAVKAKELATVNAQLKRADPKKYGDKDKKPKSQSIAQLNPLAAMEAMLRREEAELYKAIQNGTADKPIAGTDYQTTRRQRVEALRESVKKTRDEAKNLRKDLDFLDKVRELNIDGLGKIDRGDRYESEGGARRVGLVGSLEKRKASVNTDAYEQKAGRENEVLQQYEANRTRFQKLPGFLQDIFKSVSVGARALDQEVQAGTDEANAVLRQKANDFSDLLEGMAQIGADFAQSALPQIGNQFFSGLADSINQGNDEPLKKALQGIKDMLSDYLIQIGTSLVIAGGLELLGAPIPGIGIGLALSGGQKLAVGGAMLAGGVGLKAAGPSRKSKGYATGGAVLGEGSSTSDSIPAWLSNGEFVMKADAVRKVGVPYLNALNDGRARPALNRMSSTPLRLDQPNPKLSSSLNHLKGIMREANGGDETIRQERFTRVRGNDLDLVNARTLRKKRSYGRD